MGKPSPVLLDHPAANQLASQGFVYERRQPELGALHRAVRSGWPQVKALARERTGAALPEFVDKAMKAYIGCGQLSNGFARFRCSSCPKDVLVAFSCKVRGLCPSCAGKTAGAVLSDLARSALLHPPGPPPDSTAVMGFEPFASRGQVVTTELVRRLQDEED